MVGIPGTNLFPYPYPDGLWLIYHTGSAFFRALGGAMQGACMMYAWSICYNY